MNLQAQVSQWALKVLRAQTLGFVSGLAALCFEVTPALTVMSDDVWDEAVGNFLAVGLVVRVGQEVPFFSNRS